MYQYDDASCVSALPTPAAAGTPGYFSNGNPASGQAATLLTADFMNTLMMELANVVTGAGLALSKTTYNQVLSAIKRIGQNTVVLADTGAANAYTAVNAVPLVAGTWVDGVVQAVKIAHTNTGASTYAPDGLTAIPIYGLGLQPLQGGELLLNGTAILMHLTIAGVNSGNSIAVLMECAGGAQQVAAATQSGHASQLGQVQSGLSSYAVDSGAANAYVITLAPAILAYADGVKYRFRAANANTGASTLNINGLGVVSLVGGAHSALTGGEIIAGGYCEAEYNSTLAKLVLLECTGAPLQVAAGVGSLHAVNLGQVQAGVNYAAAAGAADALTATIASGLSALTDGMSVTIKAAYANATTTPTLNLTLGSTATGAKTIVKGAGAAVAAGDIAGANHELQLTYNLTLGDWVLNNPATGVVAVATPAAAQQTIAASVASSALTLTYTPSGPLAFRNASLTSGVPVSSTISSALTLTVPSGATLGCVAAQLTTLVLLVAYNGGSPVLCVANLYGGLDLSETNLISPTTISSSATSSSTIYSASAVSANSPYRVVGSIKITEATAGTWATAPTLVQGQGGEAMAALQSIGYGQTWQNVLASRASATTYYNTTSRPILVSIYAGQSGSTCTLTVNGVVVAGSANAATSLLSAIVPPGGSYILSTASVTYWAELQ